MNIVAFGGGHGLGASLRALRRCAAKLDPLRITAVVTVGDNGGSSGRLRAQRAILPPGDLRQALAALAADDFHHATVGGLFQHRFRDGAGAEADDGIAGHPVGNLVLCGLMELLDDPVLALDQAAAMVGAAGRVLPMSRQPVQIEATVRGADPADPRRLVTIRGQHEVAVSPGQVESVRLDPAVPEACAEAVAEVEAADWLVFGPGSWYTSVIPHLMVPDLAAAIIASRARRLVVLNLTTEPETAGLTLPEHLTALATYAPHLGADVVLGDANWVTDPGPVRRAAESLGAQLLLAPVAADLATTDLGLTGPNDRVTNPNGGVTNPGGAGFQPRHDPEALAGALLPVLAAR